MELVLGFVLGIVASAVVAICVEYSTRPLLGMIVAESNRAHGELFGEPSHEFQNVAVRNLPAKWPLPGRRPAWSCKANIEVFSIDGRSLLPAPILARWISQPEPIFPISDQGKVVHIPDIAKMIAARKIDIHNHDDQMLSVALKFDGEQSIHLFSNESYLHPRGQNPDWCLEIGTYRLRLTVFYERGTAIADFELANLGQNINDVNVRPWPNESGVTMTNEVRYRSLTDIWLGHGFFALLGYLFRKLSERLTPTRLLFNAGGCRILGQFALDARTEKVAPWWQDMAVLIHVGLTALVVHFGMDAAMSPSSWSYTIAKISVWYLLIDMMSYHTRVLWFDDLAVGESAQQRMVWSHRRVLFHALINLMESIALFPVLYGKYQAPIIGYLELLNHSFYAALALEHPPSLKAPLALINVQLGVSVFFLLVVISVVASIAFKRPELSRSFDDC